MAILNHKRKKAESDVMQENELYWDCYYGGKTYKTSIKCEGYGSSISKELTYHQIL